jgi:hypothetical protein
VYGVRSTDVPIEIKEERRGGEDSTSVLRIWVGWRCILIPIRIRSMYKRVEEGWRCRGGCRVYI